MKINTFIILLILILSFLGLAFSPGNVTAINEESIKSEKEALEVLKRNPGSFSASLYLFNSLSINDYQTIIKAFPRSSLDPIDLSNFFIVYKNENDLIIRKNLYRMANFRKENFLCTGDDSRHCNNQSTFYIDTTDGKYLFISNLSDVFNDGFSQSCPEFFRMEKQFLIMHDSNYCGGSMDSTEDYYHTYQVKNNDDEKFAVYKNTKVSPTSITFFPLFLIGLPISFLALCGLMIKLITMIVKRRLLYKPLLFLLFISVVALIFTVSPWWGPKFIHFQKIEEPCPNCGG